MAGEESTMGFFPYAAGAGALAGYLGGSHAADAQRQAAQQAAEMQWRIYQQQRADAEPWRQAGITGLNGITNNLGDYTRNFTMSDFTQDPGYAFRMQEGQKALERSAAAKGGLYSGRTMKELTKYGQDMGAQEYGNAYNRFNADRDRTFGRLSQLAGIGQTANGQVSNAASNFMNANSESIYGAGNANAAGANALPGAINSGLNNWMMYQLISQK